MKENFLVTIAISVVTLAVQWAFQEILKTKVKTSIMIADLQPIDPADFTPPYCVEGSMFKK